MITTDDYKEQVRERRSHVLDYIDVIDQARREGFSFYTALNTDYIVNNLLAKEIGAPTTTTKRPEGDSKIYGGEVTVVSPKSWGLKEKCFNWITDRANVPYRVIEAYSTDEVLYYMARGVKDLRKRYEKLKNSEDN